ncbi:MAG: hypothetical protein IID51_09100 [Proteobacteria bacterium]|nr:hypothetical protein [Pseudomonadota bacterium]
MSQIQAYDIKSFCRAYSVSRSYVYLEFKSGRLKFFKAGRRTLISRESAERWQRLLEETGSEGHTPRSPKATQTAHID